MTQQIINIGTAPNDGTGDPARTAFIKSNDNFTELYARGSLTAPQGRLTLVTATPVMTTTQTAKTTTFYTPYVGNKVPIYDGTNMVMTTFAELSVATTDATKSPAAIGVSKVNDWFVWSDSGTIRIGHGPDWTDDVTRSAGTALTMVNGILLNNVSITNGPAASRGTYVGTTRSNASSQLDWIYGGVGAGGVQAFLGVWNAYNRCRVATFVGDNTDTWVYASAAWRVANAAANMYVRFISGLAEDAFSARYMSLGTSTYNGAIGVGINSTTAFTGNAPFVIGTVTQQFVAEGSGTYLGFGYVTALEYGNASSTFCGDNGLAFTQSSSLHFNFMM